MVAAFGICLIVFGKTWHQLPSYIIYEASACCTIFFQDLGHETTMEVNQKRMPSDHFPEKFFE